MMESSTTAAIALFWAETENLRNDGRQAKDRRACYVYWNKL